ncbi:MAG: helix-turn-helix domain-containing protein [Prevotella sp.]|nr:helix-turn-helix domain-containing protein [Prevotella sp.]
MSIKQQNNSIVKQFVNINEKPLKVEETAELLGIGRWGVLKRIERGLLPTHKNGRRWYVLKSELMDYIRNQ